MKYTELMQFMTSNFFHFLRSQLTPGPLNDATINSFKKPMGIYVLETEVFKHNSLNFHISETRLNILLKLV